LKKHCKLTTKRNNRIKQVAIVKSRIKAFRKERGFSQDDMAEALGVHKNTYQSYENPNDESQFSMIRFFEMCEILGIVPGNLFPLGEETRQAIKEAMDLAKYLEQAPSHARKVRERLNRYE
tara:strand:- start:367 stop:729 length:363 start_codon:yes stop_codon:yes gene_type:complete